MFEYLKCYIYAVLLILCSREARPTFAACSAWKYVNKNVMVLFQFESST